MADDGNIDYSVHEAWNEATNVYLIVILVSFGLFMYARKNKKEDHADFYSATDCRDGIRV